MGVYLMGPHGPEDKETGMRIKYLAMLGAALLVGYAVVSIGQFIDKTQADVLQRLSNAPYQTR
jgi:hypothetical protein